MVAVPESPRAPRDTSASLQPYSFKHPLLQLSVRSKDSTTRYADFGRLVRRALDLRLTPARRAERAEQVLAAIQVLNLSRDDTDALRSEWLEQVAEDCGTPTLLEALAQSRLSEHDLRLTPFGWPGLNAADLEMPRLLPLRERAGPGASAPVPKTVSDVWRKAVSLALEAVTEQQLRAWKAVDCTATLRMLALLALLGEAQGSLDTASKRLRFFEGTGLGLWQALATRLHSHDRRIWSGYRDGMLQRRVLLQLQGLAQAEAYGSTRCGQLQEVKPEPGVGWLQVVHGPIPPAANRDDVDTLRAHAALLEPLPVAAMPAADELDRALRGLREEFPWAEAALDELESLLGTRSLFGVKELVLGPVLLVGLPGSGKSRLVRRLAQVLKLPYLPVALGGNHDGKVFLGTARGWFGGMPSPLLTLLQRRRSASALVLLDEIDKVGQASSNAPPMHSTLLGLLERETAARWYDSFLQTTCDLSRVSFWATANGLASVPRPLLSRFTVVYMPEPGPKHREVLVRGITHELADEWGLPREVLPLAPAWVYAHAGRNARELRRCVLHYLNEWAQEHRRRERMH